MLCHIMRYYAHFGHQQFVLCLGYRANAIQDYFQRQEFRDAGWEIDFVDTGLDASIGERLARAREHVADDEVFLASYGDTLTDAPLPGDLSRSSERRAVRDETEEASTPAVKR